MLRMEGKKVAIAPPPAPMNGGGDGCCLRLRPAPAPETPLRAPSWRSPHAPNHPIHTHSPGRWSSSSSTARLRSRLPRGVRDITRSFTTTTLNRGEQDAEMKGGGEKDLVSKKGGKRGQKKEGKASERRKKKKTPSRPRRNCQAGPGRAALTGPGRVGGGGSPFLSPSFFSLSRVFFFLFFFLFF